MSDFAPWKCGSKGLIWAIFEGDFEYFDYYSDVAGDAFEPNQVLKALCLVKNEERILTLFENPKFDYKTENNYLLRWAIKNNVLSVLEKVRTQQSFAEDFGNEEEFLQICLLNDVALLREHLEKKIEFDSEKKVKVWKFVASECSLEVLKELLKVYEPVEEAFLVAASFDRKDVLKVLVAGNHFEI